MIRLLVVALAILCVETANAQSLTPKIGETTAEFEARRRDHEAASNPEGSPLPRNAQQGGWEFTRWGMTLSEVMEASGGQAQSIQPGPGAKDCTFTGSVCLAYIPHYKLAGFPFEIRFGFEATTKRLNRVVLYANGDAFYELERALTGAFGAPIASERGRLPVSMWRDPAKGNTIRVLRVVSSVIEYTPIASGF
jgi:hypothetical protein